MRATEDDVRELLGRLTVPPGSPRFFEELRGRMQEQDRASARRWRLAAVVVAAVALPVVAATAVVAATRGGGSTVERTVSCSVRSNLEVYGLPSNPSYTQSSTELAEAPRVPTNPMMTNGSTVLFLVDAGRKGFVLDGSRCRPTTREAPLARSGLPVGEIYTAGDYRSYMGVCAFSGRVLVHLRVHLRASGDVRDAEYSVWRQLGARTRPLAFEQWTPTRTATYLSNTCREE